MVIDFRNTTIQRYSYSIVGNRNYDKILFFTHLIDAQDYDTYLKFESDECVDKIKIPSNDIVVDTENEVIEVKWTMTQLATMSKKLKVQLSFEKEENDETTLIAQSRVVELSLGNTIDVYGDIPIIYPTIIEQILHDIHELQGESVASLGVAYESDTLMIDLYNAKHEHLGTQLQVSIPTALNINDVSYNAGVFTFTHNDGTTDSVDLKDTFYTEDEVNTLLNNKVDKVEGKGLSTNDFTNEDKTKLENIEAGAEVNVIEGVNVNNEPLTPTNKIVNIDLSAYALNSDMRTYAKSLTLSIDNTTYVMTLVLKDANNNTLSSQSVDLPLESIITSATYYDTYTYEGTTYNKVIVIVLSTTTIPTIVPVVNLVAGLVNETQLNTILLNYYTKSQTDALLSGKQDTMTAITTSEIDAWIGG